MDNQYFYHYTSNQVFLDVVEKKKLWLSAYGFMNDISEGTYCNQIAEDVLSELANLEQDPARKQDLQFIGGMINHGVNQNGKYIFSLSKYASALSQWRAYTPNKGVSIGFPEKNLRDFCSKNNFSFSECTYGYDNHWTEIKEMVEKELTGFDLGDADQIQDVCEKILGKLIEWGLHFKDESFEDEQEHRMIVPPRKSSQHESIVSTLKLRVNDKNDFIPYVEVDISELFSSLNRSSPLVICFSPGNYSKKHQILMEHWLKTVCNVEAVEFGFSGSPYRG